MTDNTINTARNLGLNIPNLTINDFVGSTDLNDYFAFRFDRLSDFDLTIQGGRYGFDLYHDVNNNGIIETGETLLQSTPDGSTQSTGNSFSTSISNTSINGVVTKTISLSGNLNFGQYYIRVYSNGSNTNYTMNLSSVALPLNKIQGNVWHDLNANGIKDVGEPNLVGRTIFIDANNNSQLDSGELTSITDADGNYRFDGLGRGTHIIRELTPNNWISSFPESGYYSVYVNSGNEITGKDFGSYQYSEISGIIWNDANKNGIQDPGELGIPNSTVFLDKNQNNQLDIGEIATVTDGNGNYKFANLIPGTYYISQVLPDNWQSTYPNFNTGNQNANINVTYDGFSPEAQAAFQYAVDVWERWIISDITIEIEAQWSELDPEVLGQAGSSDYKINFINAPKANTWYPIALANHIANQDLAPNLSDISAQFNSNFNWYYGTDGNTPAGQYDLVSVVLHEIGHGLGFNGSVLMNEMTGILSWGLGTHFPIIFDRFVVNSLGQSILDTNLFPNYSEALANQLTSDDLYFNGVNAKSANGGINPKLYAPAIWDQGSSYAHLDEETYIASNPNSLMTPAIESGQSIHEPGEITLGIFEDIGWTINRGSTSTSSYEIDLTSGEIVNNANFGNAFKFNTPTEGTVNNDEFITTSQTDIINALAGDDTITSTFSNLQQNDYLNGNIGIDTLIITGENASDIININANNNTNQINISGTTIIGFENFDFSGFTGTVNFVGTSNNDNFISGSGNDYLNGGLGADTISGGGGNDTYIVDNKNDVTVEEMNQGNDTVESSITWILANNLENLTLTGTSNIQGTGNNLNNTIIGNSGSNSLDGKAGADTMIGGLGTDKFYVDNIGDFIIENLNQGTDSVFTTVSYTLANNVENLTLQGTSAINGTGNNLNNLITGNNAANVISGDSGNDNLDGKTGADTMIGGLGNDKFYVDNIGDTIIENLNQGTDSVLSTVTHTLANNVENLTLQGTSAINGTGNNLNNRIIGNAAANVISGGIGNDNLDGKAGTDTLLGGLGNDQIYLGTNDGAVDIVYYTLGNGIDTVYQFVRGFGGDLIQFTGINNIDVVISGSSTQLRIGDGIANNDGFAAGDLLITLSGTSGFTTANVSDNLLGANFFFS